MYLNNWMIKYLCAKPRLNYLKGALQILDNSVYKLATFFASNVYPTNPPFNAIHPFPEIQIRAYLIN